MHKTNGQYYIENPSYTGPESKNFADKWNEHPERADAFFSWVEAVQKDLVDNFSNLYEEIETANSLDNVDNRNMICGLQICF
ncbi:MAG: hypothetical protein GXY32_05980 [Ruminococcaceae bacterium]|nr:hypothetical protein [Oscillospiraceae bacterium]